MSVENNPVFDLGETILIKKENGGKIQNIIRNLREDRAQPRSHPAAEGKNLKKLSGRLDTCFLAFGSKLAAQSRSLLF